MTKGGMRSKSKKEISHTSEVRVRFAECDPLGIVWHGNYIQYFEDGREAFGRHHGISYLDQKANNFSYLPNARINSPCGMEILPPKNPLISIRLPLKWSLNMRF